MVDSQCKACGKRTLRSFLSFGRLPLGNAFLKKDQVNGEKKFKLELGFCSSCHLVQQVKPPPSGSLARVYRNYRYVPVGSSLRGNLASLSRSIADEFGLDANSFFLDVGSNDGALLSGILERCRVLGIEPAVDISEMARKAGVDTMTGFFTPELAGEVLSERGQADVVTATQVLQHIPDVMQFMRSIRSILKPSGIFVVEGRYFADTVSKCSFDTVYHEMLYFFTLTSLVSLFGAVGLQIFRAKLVDVYGGSLLVYAKLKDNMRIPVEDSVAQILASEKVAGLD